MAMDEIMMAVNSDVSVPLDERMRYVGGVVPRGIRKRTVSKTVSDPNQTFDGSVLDITGAGCMFVASSSVTTPSARSMITIDIDDGKKTIVISDKSSNNSSASLAVNMANVASDIDLSESTINVPVGTNATANDCISFEKSLKVSFYLSSPTTSYSASASVSYGLFE